MVASTKLVQGTKERRQRGGGPRASRPTPAAFAPAILGLLLLALSPVTTPAHAQSEPGVAARHDGQPFSTASPEWEGYSEFVRLAQRSLGTARVSPTAQLDFGKLLPNDAVIIVRPLRPLDEASLSAFLADGGRVALLDDFGKGSGLLQKFGIQRVPAPVDPQERLRDNPDLAIAVPSVQVVAGAEKGRHPIAQHVDAVVTNHPMVLRHPDLTPVLEIRDSSGRGEALAVTGVIAKKGRLFALGDPSVFINLMLRYPGNRNLAAGLIEYLAERNDLDPDPDISLRESAPGVATPPGKIWIVANDFDQLGHYGEDETLLEQLKRQMKEAAEAILAVDDEGLPPMMATFLAAMLALWAIHSQLKGNFYLPRLVGHSFARAPILAAQTGLGARADILSSRKANPILALMEIDAALRETAERRLGVNPAGAQKELTEALARSGLSAGDAASLATLLADLRSFGQSLGQGRPRRATESSMKKYHRESMRLLNEMERVGNKS